MDRQELLDRLRDVAERGVTVTLTLRPVTGCCGDQLVCGKVIALAESYAVRRTPQVVFRRRRGVPLMISLPMIKDFEVGVRRPQPPSSTGE